MVYGHVTMADQRFADLPVMHGESAPNSNRAALSLITVCLCDLKAIAGKTLDIVLRNNLISACGIQ